MKNTDTGESEGFAFVSFRTKDVAQTAIEELNNKDFKGRTLKCSLAESKYRLFIGNVPKSWTDDEFRKLIEDTGHGAEIIELIKFVYAGRYVLAKLAISKDMKPYVFVFYRQAFALLSLAPFAFFLEREKPPQLPLNLLCKIFFVSLGRITLSLNLDSYSMNYISATFAAAIGNTVPAITFIMALCLRMESISVKHWHGSAKVIGSAV